MRRSNALRCVLLAALLAAGQLPTLRAAIVLNGDVYPTEATAWLMIWDGYVGKTGLGTLEVNNNSDLYSWQGYIGDASGSTGVVTVDGAGSTWTNTSSLYVGNAGIGTLSITDGGAVSSPHGYVGYSPGSTGAVTVGGAGSTWTSGSDLRVGFSGIGTLSITVGGTVSSTYGYIGDTSDATGVVTVDGAGSKWTNGSNLYVGNSGIGTLSITDGGAVSSSFGCVGYDSGATGVVTVDGAGSTWTNSSGIALGYSGIGTLRIAGGAAVSNTSGTIGLRPGSVGVVTVDGADSKWTNSSVLYVGYSGSGTLNITGGTVVNSTGYVGYDSSSTSVVTVDGADSTWSNLTLYVGYSGSGTLSITSGATVSVAGVTLVAYETGSTGLIDFGSDGGTLTTNTLDCASPTQLTGTGTINTQGLVGDFDLVFDSTHGANQTLTLASQPGQNVTVHLDLSGESGDVGVLGVGYRGEGSLSIRDGVVVKSAGSYVGRDTGSMGVVTVDGAGSAWASRNDIFVGRSGSGTLDITGGAAVSNRYGYLGEDSGAMGAVTVDGEDSTWTNSMSLYVGNFGSGTLCVTGGGAVSNRYGYLGAESGATGAVTVDGAASTWTNSYNLFVGHSGAATLNITGGGAVRNPTGYVGYYSGATGEVTVDGAGSTWTNSGDLYVGCSGNGTLRITGGATVSVAGCTYVSYGTSPTGLIDFGSGGGTLSTNTLVYTSPTHFTGAGTINARGMLSDLALVCDSTCGANQSFTLASQLGQDVTVNLDMSGESGSTGDLGVGYQGEGSLSIRDGIVVRSVLGYVGWKAGSTGIVTVDGAGSTWANSDELRVGHPTGGIGTLNITGGGAVMATRVSVIVDESLLAIDVGRGSLLTINGGRGTINNGGIVRFLAGSGVAPGDFRPIAALTWSGSGVYQGVGGAWDVVGHRFVVSAAELGTGGAMTTIDPAVVQRLVISDDATGWAVGAGFLASATSKSLHFTATPIDSATLDDLAGLLEGGEAVRGAWTFDVGGTGYAAGNPVYLSFDLSGDLARSDLNVWRYYGSQWSAFDALDLTYDGQYASFTVTNFSGYAVSVVPEPGTLALLLAAALAVLIHGRRKRKWTGSQRLTGGAAMSACH